MAQFDFKNNKVLKYSGLATQMFVTLGIAALIGKWMDRKFDLGKPICTAALPIIMLVFYIIWLNYDLKKIDK